MVGVNVGDAVTITKIVGLSRGELLAPIFPRLVVLRVNDRR